MIEIFKVFSNWIIKNIAHCLGLAIMISIIIQFYIIKFRNKNKDKNDE